MVTAALAVVVTIGWADSYAGDTQVVPGVVIDTDTASHLEFSRYKTQTVTVEQSRISIPGRTFWWDHSFEIRERVAVEVVIGRFTGWRYISSVKAAPNSVLAEPPAP